MPKRKPKYYEAAIPENVMQGTSVDYSAMERAYLEACVGKMPPTGGIATGRVINSLLNVTTYEPDRVYLFDEYGIYPLED